jgi:NADPH:quinone reductase-like Zn-dependent oxidoreductase
MRAIIQDAYGAPDRVLRLDQVEVPAIGAGDVLVRVHATSVNTPDWATVIGVPYILRLGSGLRRPKRPVRGSDVAGVVTAVGRDVTDLAPGDAVFGSTGARAGAFAECAVAPAAQLIRKPPGLAFADAAASVMTGLAALVALRDLARTGPGTSVLINGASGGVGTLAVQIAKALGAEVTGVCGPGHADLVRSLGADHVIDYTAGDTEGGHRYDVIIDTGGHRPLRRLRRSLTPRGTLVIVGSETGGRWLGGFDRTIRAMLLSPFIRQTLAPLANSENAADLVVLTELVQSGKVTPVIDRTYPLEEVSTAIERMQAGQARGKLVVSVFPGTATPDAGGTP